MSTNATQRDVAILVLHGMGSHRANFADRFIRNVNRRLQRMEVDPSRVAWRSVHWGPVIDRSQDNYLHRAGGIFDWWSYGLRRFVVTALGDPTAYQPVISRSMDQSVHVRIHALIAEKVRELYELELLCQPKPLIILAHSLGGHIISNYIWDMQQQRSVVRHELSDFEKMHTLTGFITFGCNLPLFTFAFPNAKPIEFPPPQLPEGLRAKARWINLYNPADVLGYPLRPISEGYGKAPVEDIPMRNGGFPWQWTPLAHSRYWGDRAFAGTVAGMVGEVAMAKW